VLAYIQTYNNMLSSAGSSSDRTLERSAKQLKNITSEYSSELDKIGITINDDGTLTSRTTLFESADLSKFKELFSADAAYMQRTSTYAKRFASRGEALVASDNNRLMQKKMPLPQVLPQQTAPPHPVPQRVRMTALPPLRHRSYPRVWIWIPS